MRNGAIIKAATVTVSDVYMQLIFSPQVEVMRGLIYGMRCGELRRTRMLSRRPWLLLASSILRLEIVLSLLLDCATEPFRFERS